MRVHSSERFIGVAAALSKGPLQSGPERSVRLQADQEAVSGLAGPGSAYRLTTGGMLTITPELDFVSGLLAVLAAVLPKRAVRFDDALTGGVRTLRC